MPKKKPKKTEYTKFLKAEKKNIELTKKHYNKEISMYIDCFNLLAQTLYHIIKESYKQRDILRRAEVAILINSTRVLFSIKTYIDLMMKGYYFDAHIIFRSLYENILLIECFTRDEKYATKWLNEELKFSKVKKELGLYSNEALTRFYEDLCGYVHANAPALTSLIKISKEKDEISIPVLPSFRPEQCPEIDFFPAIGYRVLLLLLNLFRNVMKPEVTSQIEKALDAWKIEGEVLLRKSEEIDKELKESTKSSPK